MNKNQPFRRVAELLGMNRKQAAKALNVPESSGEKVDWGSAGKYATGITIKLAEALEMLPDKQRKKIAE